MSRPDGDRAGDTRASTTNADGSVVKTISERPSASCTLPRRSPLLHRLVPVNIWTADEICLEQPIASSAALGDLARGHERVHGDIDVREPTDSADDVGTLDRHQDSSRREIYAPRKRDQQLEGQRSAKDILAL